MIEVYRTLLNENEIIGVGPLFSKRQADPTLVQLYNERQFYFDIFIKGGGCVLITTDWLCFKEPHIESSRLAHDAIYTAHKVLWRCLIDNVFTELLVYKVGDVPLPLQSL